MLEEKSKMSSGTGSLRTGLFGQKAIYYPRVTSTMDIARNQARKGTEEGTIVIAGEQTQGRGRVGRTWLSPEGNMALSIVLYPDISKLPFLVIIASVAVARGIEKVTGLKTMIKWPNDILIGTKKVGGILIENEVKRDKVLYAIVGIGLNVNISPEEKEKNQLPATCLKDELGGNVIRTSIIKSVLREMERLYLMLPDCEPVIREWRERLMMLGKNVRVYNNDAVIQGVAEAVDDTGALILRHADGSSTTVVAGDVSLRDDNRE
jgi:BirA family biotin operon repressor/biotin-[acetyl-CoA-carboxylase] ligase